MSFQFHSEIKNNEMIVYSFRNHISLLEVVWEGQRKKMKKPK